jgi:hypothetical protein
MRIRPPLRVDLVRIRMIHRELANHPIRVVHVERFAIPMLEHIETRLRITRGAQAFLNARDQLAGALAPDGLLAVGVSESLLRFGTSMVCVERGGSFFYQRAQ